MLVVLRRGVDGLRNHRFLPAGAGYYRVLFSSPGTTISCGVLHLFARALKHGKNGGKL